MMRYRSIDKQPRLVRCLASGADQEFGWGRPIVPEQWLETSFTLNLRHADHNQPPALMQKDPTASQQNNSNHHQNKDRHERFPHPGDKAHTEAEPATKPGQQTKPRVRICKIAQL